MTKNVFVVNNSKFGAENIFSKSEEIVVVLYNMRDQDHAQLIDGKTKFQTNFVKLSVGQLSRCPCIVHTSFPDLFSIYLDRTIKINLYVKQNTTTKPLNESDSSQKLLNINTFGSEDD